MILPIVAPFVVIGFVLVAITSVSEYLISYMASGFAVEALLIWTFNSVRDGYSPVVASAAIGIFCITVISLLGLSLLTDLLKLLGARRH